MRHILLVASLAFLVAGAAGAQTAKDLWPLGPGNQWTYEVTGPNVEPREDSMQVVGTSGSWAQLANLWDTRWWWTSGQSGRIYTWDATARKSTLAFDLRARQGTKFKVSAPGAGCMDGTTWEVKNSDLTIETPVGTFEHCVHIAMVQPVCRSQPKHELVFAPKVGIVKYVRMVGVVGPETWNLVHATVDGTEYHKIAPAVKGLSARITLDRYTYPLTVTRSMPPLPPRTTELPSTLAVEFVLTNQTSDSVTFDFVSGQEYDFVIRDEAGKMVWIWSANKRFAQMFHSKVLAPGQSFTFTDSIELRGLDGVPLPEGRYTIEGVHTTDPTEMRASATATFRVERIFAS